MAQNITINGENFQSVPSVVLPKTGGGSASFVDTTDATATPSEILQGYTAYGADGTKLTGTAAGGVVTIVDTQDAAGGTIREITASETFTLQGNKSVTPSETAQTITPDTGYDAFAKVSVGAISSTYVGSDIARKSSSDLTASGATVTVPAGYYSSQASKAVASGSATTPATTITANPTISVSTGGLITATASTSQNVTPTVSAGYVSSGTAGKITVSGSKTQQLTVKAASTYNVNTSNQTIASGQYLTGTQTIRGVTTSNISAANIKSGVVVKVGDSADDDRIAGVTGTFTAANTVSSGQTAAGASQILSGYSGFVDGAEVKGNIVTKTSSNLTASGATVTVPAGYYASEATKSVATATHANPTASINSSTGVVTASHTQAAGYVAAGTTTGTLNLTTQAAKTVTPTTSAQTAVAAGRYTTGAVTVAAIPSSYIQPAGTISITANGTHNVNDYKTANVNVPIPDGYIQPAGTTTITTNGTHNVNNYKAAEVNIQPNLESNKNVIPSQETQIITAGTYNIAGTTVFWKERTETINISTGQSNVYYQDSTADLYYKLSYEKHGAEPIFFTIKWKVYNENHTVLDSGSFTEIKNPSSYQYNITFDNHIGSGATEATLRFDCYNSYYRLTMNSGATQNLIYELTMSGANVATGQYDGLAQVTVEAIPSSYIQPAGTLDITTDGTYDVKNYASASVNVSPTYTLTLLGAQGSTYTIEKNGGTRQDFVTGATYSFVPGDTFKFRIVDGGTIYLDGEVVSTGGGYTNSYTFTTSDNDVNVTANNYKIYIENIISTISITENGTYNVKDYTVANVSVSALCNNYDDLITRTISGNVKNETASIVGRYAFAQCSKIDNVEFTLATLISPSAFMSCSSLLSVSFPVATTIDAYAFSGCSKLRSITFPDLQSIGNYVFQYCYSLSIVSLPKASFIGAGAFSNCRRLVDLYLLGSRLVTLSSTNAFNNTIFSGYSTYTSNGYIHVPSSLYSSYLTATNWSFFSSFFVSE